MQFRVLGPLEVVNGGAPLEIRGAKQRALLSALLLHANESVSRERLIDGLWGDQPPRGADHSLDEHVSRLRRVLHENGRDLLLTRPSGYMLSITDEQLDLVRFRSLADEGRAALRAGEPERAAGTLRDALSLWRGPALQGVDHDSFASVEVRELEERRLSAYEDLIEAELACGHHAEIVPELGRCAELNPLRERLHAQLMLALYRSGRQADALDAYRNARHHFAHELGIEPGPDLRELEQAILRQDATLASPASSPAANGARGRTPTARTLPDAGDVGRPDESGTRPRRLRVRVALGAAAVVVVGGIAAIVLITGETSAEVAVAPNSVAAIDPRTDKVVADIADVGSDPNRVAVGNSGVWVTSRRDQLLTRIDPITKKRSFTRGLTVTPVDLAAGDGGVWIAGGRGGQVVRFDPSSKSLETIRLADQAASADWLDVVRGAVWVYGTGLGFEKVDPATRQTAHPIESDGGPFVVRDGTAWYAPTGFGYPPPLLGRTDLVTATHGERVTLPDTPIAVANGTDRLWATVPGSLFPINPATGAAEPGMKVGRQPIAVAVGAGSVWVANAGVQGFVSAVSPSSGAVKTIKLPDPPVGIAVGDGLVWVAVGSP